MTRNAKFSESAHSIIQTLVTSFTSPLFCKIINKNYYYKNTACDFEKKKNLMETKYLQHDMMTVL